MNIEELIKLLNEPTFIEKSKIIQAFQDEKNTIVELKGKIDSMEQENKKLAEENKNLLLSSSKEEKEEKEEKEDENLDDIVNELIGGSKNE